MEQIDSPENHYFIGRLSPVILASRLSLSAVLLSLIGVVSGCAQIAIVKQPLAEDTGVRFFRPKLYLLVESAPQFSDVLTTQTERVKQTQTTVNVPLPGSTNISVNVNAGVNSEQQASPVRKLIGTRAKLSLKLLPDYSEEYSLHVTGPSPSIVLQDGWNLVGINASFPGLLQNSSTQVDGLAENCSGPETGYEVLVDVDSSVAYGLYESFFIEEYGRKVLAGWKYIGFLPLSSNCPPARDDLWGIVFSSRGAKFEKLRQIAARQQ